MNKEVITEQQRYTRKLYAFITFICGSVAIGFTGLLVIAVLSNLYEEDKIDDPYINHHRAVHKADQEKLDRIVTLLEELD